MNAPVIFSCRGIKPFLPFSWSRCRYSSQFCSRRSRTGQNAYAQQKARKICQGATDVDSAMAYPYNFCKRPCRFNLGIKQDDCNLASFLPCLASIQPDIRQRIRVVRCSNSRILFLYLLQRLLWRYLPAAQVIRFTPLISYFVFVPRNLRFFDQLLLLTPGLSSSP